MKEIRITELAHNRLMRVLAHYIKHEMRNWKARGCLAGENKNGIIQDIVMVQRHGGCVTMGTFPSEHMGIAVQRLTKQNLSVHYFIRVGCEVCDTEELYEHADQINHYGLTLLSLSPKEICEVVEDEWYPIKYTIISKKERRVKKYEKEIPVCGEREGLGTSETSKGMLVQN